MGEPKYKSYRDESRKTYGNTVTDGVSLQGLNAGSLQRIADGVEKMAQRWDELQRDLDWARSDRDRYKKQYEKAAKSNRGLKAVITRMKNKEARTMPGSAEMG